MCTSAERMLAWSVYHIRLMTSAHYYQIDMQISDSNPDFLFVIMAEFCKQMIHFYWGVVINDGIKKLTGSQITVFHHFIINETVIKASKLYTRSLINTITQKFLWLGLCPEPNEVLSE